MNNLIQISHLKYTHFEKKSLTSIAYKVSVFGVILVIIFPYLVRMRENMDQNNSEYGHFLRSGQFDWGLCCIYLSKFAFLPFQQLHQHVPWCVFSFINLVPHKRRDPFHFCCHVYFTIYEFLSHLNKFAHYLRHV